MIREMKRALDDVKSGDKQGYRKFFDATYEEVYCRSFLILQKDEKAMDFMKGFFGELFGLLDEADDAQDQEKWLWQKYYGRIRKQYHKLLADQNNENTGARTLAEIPSALPLLHRVMLVMSYKDDFTAGEIAGTFGLAEDKIRAELEKLDKVLPALTKNQPESVAGYLSNWRVLLLGASRQVVSTGSDDWVDPLYREAAASAGIAVQEEKKDNFEYFVADVDLTPVKPKKKPAPVPVVEEEPDDDDEYDDDDDDDIDDDDDDEYDEYDDDDEDDDDEDDGRYDWDLEDDSRRMVIIGIVIALVVVLVAGIVGFKLLNRDKGDDQVNSQTEEMEDGDAELIIKGDIPGDDEDEIEEEPEEEPEEEEPEEEEPEEPETVTMEVNVESSRVRSESNTNSSIVTSVKRGEQVEVLSDTSEEWVQIRCIEQNNEEGYMMSQYLSAIE